MSKESKLRPVSPNQLTIRPPGAEDGPAVSRLIENSPPLDINSAYCNLLQCSHFASTSAAALVAEELVGFISGYRLPKRADTLFVWQVAVSSEVRGVGVAGLMLDEIIDRPANRGITWIETTITADNASSWRMFERFATNHKASTTSRLMFESGRHFQGAHDSEHLLRIGPLRRAVR